jgi:hypothetical protein
MCKTENEQKTKPKPDDYAKQLAGTVLPYLRTFWQEFTLQNWSAAYTRNLEKT